MELIAIFLVAYILGPIGGLLLLIAAYLLREGRMIRYRCMIAFAVLLGLTFAIATVAPNEYSLVLERSAVVLMGGLLFFGIAILLPPAQNNARAMAFGYGGLCCVAAAALAMYLVFQINFSF